MLNNPDSFYGNKSLDKYLCDIGKVPLLKPEEEVHLAIKIKEGNTSALKRLVNSNLRFVVSIAKEYRNQGLPFIDLINEGNMGLIKAATRFDETKGFKFISYAVWWVRQSIMQAIADHARIVRLPVNKIGSLNKIGKTFMMLEQEYEREPTVEEIAKSMNVTSQEILKSFQLNGITVSLDVPVTEREKKTLLELTSSNDINQPDTRLMEESFHQEIINALESLTSKESDVLCSYFGINRDRPSTLDEIGIKYKITRERVRQIKEKAISKLRHKKQCKSLLQYLD